MRARRQELSNAMLQPTSCCRDARRSAAIRALLLLRCTVVSHARTSHACAVLSGCALVQAPHHEVSQHAALATPCHAAIGYGASYGKPGSGSCIKGGTDCEQDGADQAPAVHCACSRNTCALAVCLRCHALPCRSLLAMCCPFLCRLAPRCSAYPGQLENMRHKDAHAAMVYDCAYHISVRGHYHAETAIAISKSQADAFS